MFQDDGEIPNNPDLPVIVYKLIFKENPEAIEDTFNRHKWTGSWTGGVFSYHHYHSNTHEVLGVKRGNATILVGGEWGERLKVETGDVVVLPAGTGHKKIKSSDEFEVVGAYPGGMNPDLRKRDTKLRAQDLSEIKHVPIPKTDPVFGDKGPLLEKWIKHKED
ncbi:cupin domain-containing protein [Bacillus sp. FJAT-49711]|uniref:cupin domain-containing protein n=1 Tax=Bacillus sp. FJAT-49711 TaxID=2833585 RepID=UPI001BC9FA96|nr:cupin domain-containing protein [Bacillus sp. FJAT-49711]MBS4218553.1 cupin domain-containing protein [Bacillus sp. FJAT-49711]